MMNQHLRLNCTIYLLCFVFHTVFAQYEATIKNSNYLQFNHLTEDVGVANMVVDQIYEDLNGFIWFSTETGLCRFDGKHFHYFSDKCIGYQLLISDIHATPNNHLWIGTEGDGLFQADLTHSADSISFIECSNTSLPTQLNDQFHSSHLSYRFNSRLNLFMPLARSRYKTWMTICYGSHTSNQATYPGINIPKRLNQLEVIAHKLIFIIRSVARIRIINSQMDQHYICIEIFCLLIFRLYHIRPMSFGEQRSP